MALNQMGLGFLFTAKDEASHVMAKIDRSFGKLTGDTRELAKTNLVAGSLGAMTMAGGLKALGKAFEFAKEAGDFNQALIDVQSISGATAEELAKLKAAALEAGIKTQFAPQEAVEGLRNLAQAGYNANDSIKLLRPSLDFAAGSLGQLNVQAASSTLTATLKAFKLNASDAAFTADKLLAVHKYSIAQIKELPSLIGHVSRGAAVFGASLEESLVAAGLARNTMGTMELASTGVSMAMERLIDPKVQKTLKGIGVDVKNDTGHFKGLFATLLNIADSPLFKKMDFTEQGALLLKAFGKRSMGAVSSIQSQLTHGITTFNNEVVKGAEAVKYLMSLEGESARGLANKFANRRLDTLPGQLLLLQSSIKALKIVLGDELVATFKNSVSFILNNLNSVLEAWQKLPIKTRQFFADMALGVTALVIAFGALVTLKSGIIVLNAVFGMLGTTFGAVMWSMAPVLVGVLALAGASYLAYQAYKTNFGGLADSVHSAWQKISLAVQGIVQLFSSGYFSGDVMKSMEDVKNKGILEFVVTIYMWGSRLKNFFAGIRDGFQTCYSDIEPALNGLKDVLGNLAAALGLQIGKADDNAKAFSKWGERGREVGVILAQLAIVCIEVLAFAIDVVAGAVQSLRDNWWWIKPAIEALIGLKILGWAIAAGEGIVGLATAMGTLSLASMGVLGQLGLIISAVILLSQLMPKFQSWGEDLGDWAARKMHPELNFNSTAGGVAQATSEPFDYSVEAAHNGGGGGGGGVTSSASPSVTVQAGRQDLSESIARLNETMKSLNFGGKAGSSVPPPKFNLVIDGHEFGTVVAPHVVDAMRDNATRSGQATSSGSPE